MSHLKQKTFIPGIVGLFNEFPETGKAMSIMAETLLRKEGPLPIWFREFIASCVSSENRTQFCGRSHMAAAKAVSSYTKEYMYSLKDAVPKYKALYDLAMIVVHNGLTGGIISRILNEEIATQEEIHDTVAITAAFCMYNRYVLGLGVDKPQLSDDDYQSIGIHLVDKGYLGEAKTTEVVSHG